ncbi:MAG TPA: hypothetical protein VFJ57_00140 [Solirubrobacterales bacterium]|nr:hypothetical protein [Solirubrobacterales bacterium]
MKRHSKAASAASTKRSMGRPSPKLLLALGAALLVALVLGVSAASAVAPTVTIENALNVEYTTATAKGEVNPEGKETSYHVEYATQAQFEASEWGEASQAGAGEGLTVATPVEAPLEGLAPGTVYHLRLVASNEDGSSEAVAGSTFKTKVVAKPTATIDAVSTFTGTTAHLAGHINPNAPEAAPATPLVEAAFETKWHFACTPACPSLRNVTPSGNVPAGNAAQTVEADAEELQPNTAYEITLVAENAGGQITVATAAAPSFKTLAVAPVIVTEPPAPDGEGGAVLTGTVNPRNSEVTNCRFEYGLTESYGQSIPCQVGPGSGAKPVSVSAHTTGMTPNVVYHFRLSATSAAGSGGGDDSRLVAYDNPPAGSCPNEDLRALQGATSLLDCRAYELVSPAHKFGGQVGGTLAAPMSAVAPDGQHLTLTSLDVLAGSSSGSETALLASRRASAWSNTSVLPVPDSNQSGLGLPGFDATFLGATQDARTSVYYNNTTSPHGSLWVYHDDGSRIRIADASVTGVGVAERMPLAGGLPGQPWFEGISADGKHVVFADTDALLPGIAETGKEILYVWNDDGSNGGNGSLDVVNRTSSATLTVIEPGASATLGGSSQHLTSSDVGDGGLRNAISTNGSRIFFQTPPPVDGSNQLPQGGGPLYVREGGSTTREVSAPAPGYSPTSPPSRIQYLDASESGRFVFFWADGDLAEGAPPAGGIYRFDTETSTLVFLATAAETVMGVPTAMASADGSRIYYQDGDKLWTYANGQSTIVFHGVVTDVRGVSSPKPSILTAESCAVANVTPDGRFFAFSADESGDDDQESQVYRYDAATGVLDRVSAGPDAPAHYEAGWVNTPACGFLGFPPRVSTRVISGDGSYVFFDTRAALVAGDSNDTMDAYQWHDGKVSLLSAGTGGKGSTVIGTGSDGHDTFFVTSDPLLREDPDVRYDIYDARVDGGLASQTEGPAAKCFGEDCQPASPPPPAAATASHTYVGPANDNVRRHPAKKKNKRKRHTARHKAAGQHKHRANADGRVNR